MKKSIYLIAGLVLMFLIFTNSSVLAADKIGFFNLDEFLENTTIGKKAIEEFKKFSEPKIQKVKTSELELQKLQEELGKQGSILTEAARLEKENSYKRKVRDFQILYEDTNKEMQERQQAIFGPLMPGIYKTVQEVAEREKYNIIFDLRRVPFMYYAKGADDITRKVVDENNKPHQKSAGKKK